MATRSARGGAPRGRLWNDFCGPEIPVSTAAAYGAQASFLGDFRVTGDLVETDTGVVKIAKSSGYVRVSGNNEDGKGVGIGTYTDFSPVLNGTLVLEARLEMQALTTRSIFVGFGSLHADDVAEPVTSTAVTITIVDPDFCGFILDSQLTAATKWHMPYAGGTAGSSTVSTTVVSDVTAVAAASDILCLEIDPNGTARWWINGVLKQTVVGAVSTTTLLSGYVACFGTTTTAADLDLDYLLVEFNRDWTR